MEKSHVLSMAVFALVALMVVPVLAPDAFAGDLFRLDMEYVGPQPDYPTHVVLNVYHHDDELRGTSGADFDGAGMSNLICDDVACITDIAVDSGSLVVLYTVNGYDAGKFKANTRFELIMGGSTTFLDLHTSCSRPIFLDTSYPGNPSGTFFIRGGDGDCMWDYDDCPSGDKIYWLIGDFRVPCAPGDLTFNLYKNDDDLKGTSTAGFDGVDLTDVICDPVACITGAETDGDDVVVTFRVRGYRGAEGRLDSNSRFELLVAGCGGFYLDLHTSCSQPVEIDYPYPTSPAGTLTLTDGCGGCISGPTATESSSWSVIKAIFR